MGLYPNILMAEAAITGLGASEELWNEKSQRTQVCHEAINFGRFLRSPFFMEAKTWKQTFGQSHSVLKFDSFSPELFISVDRSPNGKKEGDELES